jgi:hypothetical protein
MSAADLMARPSLAKSTFHRASSGALHVLIKACTIFMRSAQIVQDARKNLRHCLVFVGQGHCRFIRQYLNLTDVESTWQAVTGNEPKALLTNRRDTEQPVTALIPVADTSKRTDPVRRCRTGLSSLADQQSAAASSLQHRRQGLPCTAEPAVAHENDLVTGEHPARHVGGQLVVVAE